MRKVMVCEPDNVQRSLKEDNVFVFRLKSPHENPLASVGGITAAARIQERRLQPMYIR